VDTGGGADAVSRAQRAIERDMPEIMTRLLQSVQLDSAGTVGDALGERGRLVGSVVRAAAAAERISASSTPDLRDALVTFRISLYPALAAPFVEHTNPVPMDHFLGWQPAADYTGILIVADQPLPRFAEPGTSILAPALFPGFYYASGSPPLLHRIAEREHIPPQTHTTTGSVLYVTSLADPQLAGRIGATPFRVLARGVFGDDATDPVLSERDARRILGSETLKSLIRAGRVAIVIRPPG
jgi:hypothetical protein